MRVIPIHVMNKSQAATVAGSVTTTSKMPCKSYSLPTVACITGYKMSKIAGSICSTCYANKGNYVQYANNIEPAQHARLDSLNDELWVSAMVAHIGSDSYFRWHDSGDLQGLWHLEKIAQVAIETPIANPCSVIMPLDSVKTLAATGKKGRETVCFTVDGVKISAINPQGETMIFQAIEGKFPDCDRVVPTLTSDSGLEPSTYNPEYIAAFYDCANDLRGTKTKGISVQIKQRGNDSGIVNIDSEPLFVGIIIPMRTHNSVNIPTWCSRPKVAATEPVAA